jgi:hypothetical protein
MLVISVGHGLGCARVSTHLEHERTSRGHGHIRILTNPPINVCQAGPERRMQHDDRGEGEGYAAKRPTSPLERYVHSCVQGQEFRVEG